MARTGWDGPNRQKRQIAEANVKNAIAPALRLHGGRFSVDQMVCRMSISTRRKYLGYMVETGTLAADRIGRKVFYRLANTATGRDTADAGATDG